MPASDFKLTSLCATSFAVFSAALRLLALLAAVAALAPAPARADSVWEVVKYEGRDYLSMQNIANFYRLQYTQPTAREVVLQSPGCTIRGSADRRNS